MNATLNSSETASNSSKISAPSIWGFDAHLLEKKLAIFMLVVVLINVASVVMQLTYWMLGLMALCVLWRVSLNKKQYTSANKWLLISLALVGCILLALNGKSLGLLLTMLHLLCFSYTLKLLEMRTRKDFYQLVFIGLFILASSLIFMQSLSFFAFFVLAFIANLGLLAQFFAPTLSLAKNNKNSLLLALQSLPLALALFFLFPKLSPFWEVPFANTAKTGLSDSVSVGDVADLALSNEVAFRVTFEGDKKPRFDQLYWRTLVLDQYRDNSWYQRKLTINPRTQQLAVSPRPSSSINGLSGDYLAYRLITEASYQRWLYALDIATTESSDILHKWDYSLVSKTPITQTTGFDIKSYINAPIELELTDRQKRWYLNLPDNENPQLAKLGQELAETTNNPREVIANVLATFNQEAFYYTLQPPLLSGQVLDNFYFESKAGFCEHYASTFAFIIRAAGIPARLVVGYMGGEYNEQGDFYTIRQRDAHAWAEVWLEGEGWIRVDPTAAVSPERVENGFSDRLFQEQSSLSGDLLEFYQLSRIQWVSYLREQMANLDYQWTKWIVGYDAKRQFDLLKSFFGNNFQWKVGVIIGGAIIVTMLLLAFVYRDKRSKKALVVWQQWYLNIVQRLDKKGYLRDRNITPNQYLELVNNQSKEKGSNAARGRNSLKNNDFLAAFAQLTQSYVKFSYQALSKEEQDKLSIVMKVQYKQCNVLLKEFK